MINQFWDNYSQLSACQGEREPFKDHKIIYGHLTSLRNKPQQKKLGKFLPELLVTMYSYHLMVPYYWSVKGGFSQIQSHLTLNIPHKTM